MNRKFCISATEKLSSLQQAWQSVLLCVLREVLIVKRLLNKMMGVDLTVLRKKVG